MTQAEIDDYLEELRRRAVESLVEDGHHAPLVFLFPPGGVAAPPVLFHLGGAVHSDKGKDAATDALRLVARAMGASGAVAILESWVSKPAPRPLGRVIPSQDPFRREALIVSWEFRADGERASGMWCQFFHREDDRIVLGEVEDWSGTKGAGRFVGLLGD